MTIVGGGGERQPCISQYGQVSCGHTQPQGGLPGCLLCPPSPPKPVQFYGGGGGARGNYML